MYILVCTEDYTANKGLDGGGRESKTGQVPNNSIYFAHILSNMLGEGETASVVSKQSCVLFWMYGCVATEK